MHANPAPMALRLPTGARAAAWIWLGSGLPERLVHGAPHVSVTRLLTHYRSCVAEELARLGTTGERSTELASDIALEGRAASHQHRRGDTDVTVTVKLYAANVEEAKQVAQAACRAYDRFTDVIHHDPNRFRTGFADGVTAVQARLEHVRVAFTTAQKQVNRLAPEVYMQMPRDTVEISWLDHLRPEDVWSVAVSRSERTKTLEVEMAGLEAEQAFLNEEMRLNTAPDEFLAARMPNARRLVNMKERHETAGVQAKLATELWGGLKAALAALADVADAERHLSIAQRLLTEFEQFARSRSQVQEILPQRIDRDRPITITVLAEGGECE